MVDGFRATNWRKEGAIDRSVEFSLRIAVLPRKTAPRRAARRLEGAADTALSGGYPDPHVAHWALFRISDRIPKRQLSGPSAIRVRPGRARGEQSWPPQSHGREWMDQTLHRAVKGITRGPSSSLFHSQRSYRLRFSNNLAPTGRAGRTRLSAPPGSRAFGVHFYAIQKNAGGCYPPGRN